MSVLDREADENSRFSYENRSLLPFLHEIYDFRSLLCRQDMMLQRKRPQPCNCTGSSSKEIPHKLVRKSCYSTDALAPLSCVDLE
jgi:hypothetical protein